MMKKLTVLLLAAAMLLSLGCTGQPAESDPSSTPVSTAISAASKPEQLRLNFTEDELDRMGKTFYPEPPKSINTGTWEDSFSWEYTFDSIIRSGKAYVSYITVLEQVPAEELGDRTCYEVKIERNIIGDLPEGYTIVLSQSGAYIENQKVWYNVHPSLRLLKSGDRLLVVMWPSAFGDRYVYKHATEWLGEGISVEISSEKYLIYRSVGTTPASEIVAGLAPEDYQITRVPLEKSHWMDGVEQKDEEIAIVRPEAMENWLKEQITALATD